MKDNLNINNNRIQENRDILSSTAIESMLKSEICSTLYRAYLAMGNNGSFIEYANECWRYYRRDTVTVEFRLLSA